MALLPVRDNVQRHQPLFIRIHTPKALENVAARTAQTDLRCGGTLNQSTSSQDQQGYLDPPYVHAGLTHLSVNPTYLQWPRCVVRPNLGQGSWRLRVPTIPVVSTIKDDESVCDGAMKFLSRWASSWWALCARPIF